jgi:hypothetical protein
MSGFLNGSPFGNVVDRIWSPTGELLNVSVSTVSAALLGDNTVIPAQAGKSIYVLSYDLVVAGAVTIEFKDGVGGASLTGIQSLAANAIKVLPHNPTSWFAGSVNTLLNLSLGGAVQVSGTIQWVAF